MIITGGLSMKTSSFSKAALNIYPQKRKMLKSELGESPESKMMLSYKVEKISIRLWINAQ